MRCYAGLTIQLCLIALILGSLYIAVNHLSWRTLHEEKRDTTDAMEKNVSPYKHIWQSSPEDQNTRISFDVVIELLEGTVPSTQKYLTVGLCSVKRKKESYLMDTLHSIFSQSSQEELSQMVVVVYLADFDQTWIEDTRQEIANAFPTHIQEGKLLVIHASQALYPPLTGLKRNFNDPPDRVTYRSKQNVDYSFLMHFSANLSQYFIMVEDDVKCAKNFLSRIRQHVHKMGQGRWTTLEFSKLGYIGKFYHSEDLPLLARFLFLFYQEMPCDFLFSHFRTLLMQDKPIILKPSLFQHIGTFSSFRGTHNKLKDDDFIEEMADNPAASVFTSLKHHGDHVPENAYKQGAKFFWGLSPQEGDYFMLVFQNPVQLWRISIETGFQQKDILQSAFVEVGHTLRDSAKPPTCSDMDNLGFFHKGRFEMYDLEKTVQSTIVCLKICVTQSQNDWVRLSNILLWAKHQK